MTSSAYTDALERALARVISDARSQIEVVVAGFQARLAEAEAKLVEAEARHVRTEAELERRVMAAVEERLAALRDGQDGRDGEPGPQGERGLTGERGEAGPQGERGLDGEIGPEGPAGPPGSPGERGERGETGDIGPQGERGLDGAPGTAGERGPEGPPGRLPEVHPWEDRVYYQGDVVTHRGAVHQAARDTGREPGHEDWRCLVARGIDGRDGRSFNVRRTHDPEASYAQLDVVMVGGSSFVALHDDPGPCPGDGWQLLASRGSRGSPGEKGERGEKGDRGERGLPGAAPVAFVARDDGALTITLDDGQELTADLYPLLEKVAR